MQVETAAAAAVDGIDVVVVGACDVCVDDSSWAASDEEKAVRSS